ncbi:MAG: M48 family metalloprotease [Pseudomonadota bacterium]
MDALDAARDVLPWWVSWGTGLLYIPLAFLLSLAAASLGAFISAMPLRRFRGGPWPEKVRVVWPVRIMTSLNLLFLPILIGGLMILFQSPIARVPAHWLCVLAGLAAFAGALIVRIRREKTVQRERAAFVYRLQGFFTVWLILLPQVLVAAAVWALLPSRMNLHAAAVLAAGAAAMGFCARGGGLLAARALGLAKPASGRLTGIIEATAQRVGVRPKGVYEIRWAKANAFAFPLSGRMAFTDASLKVMSDEEIGAIAAHEMGHLAESRLVSLARASILFGLLMVAAGKPIAGSFGWHAFLVVFVSFFVLILLIKKMARRMEMRADEVAHSAEAGAGVYARALEKLHEHNMIPAVMPGKRRVHPHLYDRLLAAGVQPAYPRPGPPPRWSSRVGLLASLLPVIALLLGLRILFIFASLPARHNEQALEVLVAAGGGEERELSDLAHLRFERGDTGGSIALYRAAAATDGGSPTYPANLAIVLAYTGRCDEAKRWADDADLLTKAGGDNPGERRLVHMAVTAVDRCREPGAR